MARKAGDHDDHGEGASTSSFSAGVAGRQAGITCEDKSFHVEAQSSTNRSAAGGGAATHNEKELMKRTLVAQSKKIQQLTATIDGLESEREAMRQQVRLGPELFLLLLCTEDGVLS